MIYNHSRIKIVSKLQHILTHTLDEMSYGSPSLPGVTNAKEAIDWIASVLYPNTKAAVATPADLPTALDTPNIGDIAPTINDYRIVNDDGTGTAAGYLYAKYDTDIAAVWHKIYSFNWGINQVLQGLVNATQPLYPKKDGSTDYDVATGLAITGTFAGQSIYGGEATNQNLTLNATNFDNTGYVQFNDNVRPTINSAFNLGTNTARFLNIFTDILTSGSTVISLGTITDTSGTVDFVSDTITTLGLVSSDTLSIGTSGTIGSISISTTITTIGGTTDFSADNILTTGNISGSIGTFSSGQIGDFSIGIGSLTSLSPTINFGSNGLITTGNAGVNILTATSASIGTVDIATNIISTIGTLSINSTGLSVNSSLTVSLDTLFNGNATLSVGNVLSIIGGLSITGDTIASSGASILIASTINPTIDTVSSVGSAALRFVDIYLSGAIKGSIEQMPLVDLFRLNNTQFRDTAKTVPVSNGDNITYDSISGKWLASAPTSGTVDHLLLTNINGGINSDGGHSIFPKLLGRTGGQVISGGTAINETITLQDNTVDANGVKVLANTLIPVNFNMQLGVSSKRFGDINMDGVANGIKMFNSADTFTLNSYLGDTIALKDGAIGKKGKNLYMNNGGVIEKIGATFLKFTVDLTVSTSLATNTSATFNDSSNALWQVYDSIGNMVNIKITTGLNFVTITRDPAITGEVFTVIGIGA